MFIFTTDARKNKAEFNCPKKLQFNFNHNTTELSFLKARLCFFVFNYLLFFLISPQAIFAPELPEGRVLKSSGEEWIRIVLPIISLTEKRFDRNTERA